MSPEIESLSTATVESAVNNELQNHQMVGTATATGDGASKIFVVAPVGYYLVSSSITVTVAGVSNTAWTPDYAIGTVTFTNAPASGAAIVFNFKYVQFYSYVVTDAVQAALYAAYPYFYLTTTQSISSDGTTTEFALTAGSEAVTDVYLNTGTKYVRVPRRDYEVYDIATIKYVRFFTAPASGTLRVHSITRHTSITTLPDRAKGALVSYACYYLLVQKMAPRTRGDAAIVTQGTGTLSPRQMNDSAQAFLLRWQLQIQQVRMTPWSYGQ